MRNKDIFYESSIKDTNNINVINNYHKNKLYKNIFNQEVNLSNFLLFMNTTHRMDVEFTNNKKVENNIRNDNIRISYQIKDITPNKTGTKPFTSDLAYHLKQKDLEEDLSGLQKFGDDISNGNNFLRFKNYNVNYELPTRLSGDTFSKSINSNVVSCLLYLIPGNYELDLIIESVTELKKDDILYFTTLKFYDTDDDYFTISEDSDRFIKSKEQEEKKLIKNLDVFSYLTHRLMNILEYDSSVDFGGEEMEIPLEDRLGKNYKIYLYNKNDEVKKHSKKIKEILVYIILIIDKELDRYLNKMDESYEKIRENETNFGIINQLIDIYFANLSVESFTKYSEEMKSAKLDTTLLKEKYLTDKYLDNRNILLGIIEKINKNSEMKKLFSNESYSIEKIKENLTSIIKK